MCKVAALVGAMEGEHDGIKLGFSEGWELGSDDGWLLGDS